VPKKLINCLRDCFFLTDLFIPLLNLNIVVILFLTYLNTTRKFTSSMPVYIQRQKVSITHKLKYEGKISGVL